MRTKQTNRVTMFKTVAAYLDSHDSVWTAMAPLAAAVQQFKDQITAIDAAAQKQGIPTTGAVGDKLSARDELEDALFLTCEALGVLGSLAKDNQLLALVALSPSALHQLGEEELTHRATTVSEIANTRKTDLAPLQVTQANLDELTQALAAFTATKAKPRTAVAERMAQTASLPTLIREGSDILRNQIDRMVNLLRRSNSEFVAGYRSARVTIDRRGSHTAPAVPKTPTSPQSPMP